MNALQVYIMFSVLWGAYAVRRQASVYGWSRLMFVAAVLNTVLAPICMIIAVFKRV